MRPVTLKGTQSGYELIFDQSAGIREIYANLKTLLNQLSRSSSSIKTTIGFQILTGNRLLSNQEVEMVKQIFSHYPQFAISKITADVVTISDAYQVKEQDNVHVISKTIRNGQRVRMHGDVLFLGNLHKGGKLYTSGNIYLMGTIEGIVHAGFPSSEDKLIIGDLHNAQQVRIGEQFDVVADRQIPASEQTVAYVNDLHVLSYGKIAKLRYINPKFYNRIGGIM